MENSAHSRLLINVLHLVQKSKNQENVLHYNAIATLVSTFYLVMRLKLSESKITQQAMKKPLTELLLALQKARKDLVSRSIHEDPQLFSCLFEYENNENLLSLSFEREYAIFINNNLERIANQITDIDDSYIQNKLNHVIKELVSFRHSKNTSNIDAFFLDDKTNQIEMIFSVFDKDKDRIEEINYIRRKEQVLFDRLFKKLLGESNGIVR